MYATSPDRYGLMIENYRNRLEKDPGNQDMINTMKFYEECRRRDGEDIPKQHDMEYDLRKCDWMVAKCKDSEIYSQNLYAALWVVVDAGVAAGAESSAAFCGASATCPMQPRPDGSPPAPGGRKPPSLWIHGCTPCLVGRLVRRRV